MSRFSGWIENGIQQQKDKLPDELVEKILGMMPYPSIFKARVLSRSLQMQFSAIGAEDDEVPKRLTTPFQKAVGEFSKNWETFLVWFLGENFWAYNPVSQSWRRIFSVSFIPRKLVDQMLDKMQMDGALMLLSTGYGRKCTFYVANIFTRWLTSLPSRPHKDGSDVICSKIVSHKTLQTYKVILLCELELSRNGGFGHRNTDGRYVEIYNSESRVWSCKKIVMSEGFNSFHMKSVYYNDYLYAAGRTLDRIFAINVEDGNFEEIFLNPAEVPPRGPFDDVDLVVCNGDLMAIGSGDLHSYKPSLTYQLVKIDLVLKRLVDVAQGPPLPFNVGILDIAPISRGDSVFIGVESVAGRVLTYNIREDEWSYLPFPASMMETFNNGKKTERLPNIAYARLEFWNACSFQPGLNPFAAV